MSKHQLIRIEDMDARPSFLERVKAAYRSYTIGPMSASAPDIAKYFGGKASSAGISVDEVKALFGNSMESDAISDKVKPLFQ